MSNGNLIGRIMSWLLVEKQVSAVCTNLKARTGKSHRKWLPEVLGVSETESVEVRVRPSGFRAADFEVPPYALDARCSANYVYFVVPDGVQFDRVPKDAGVLVPTGKAKAPFTCVRAATKIHDQPPDKGLLVEVSRKSAMELSVAVSEAAELERVLNNLVMEIDAANDD